MTDIIAGAAPDHSVDKNLRWNFTVNLIDIAFITLGISLVSRDTVLPVLVSTLTDSNLAIGLIAALYGLGIYLPQLFTANFTERLLYKKPFVMLVGSFGERLPYLLMGVAVWFFAVPAPTSSGVGRSRSSPVPSWPGRPSTTSRRCFAITGRSATRSIRGTP